MSATAVFFKNTELLCLSVYPCASAMFLCSHQGCQIFLCTTYQNGKIYQKTIKYFFFAKTFRTSPDGNREKKIPADVANNHKIYKMAENIPNGHRE
jgi:hypothetical protein